MPQVEIPLGIIAQARRLQTRKRADRGAATTSKFGYWQKQATRTAAMKQRLREPGHDDEAIRVMTPEQAHKLAGWLPPPPH
jgi:hypothetical protein